VDGNFPLWTESRILNEGIGAKPGHWVIPAFALGKYRDFSTSLSPGEFMSLILASNSEIRRAMLTQAGLEFVVHSPDFDEQLVKERHVGDSQSLARKLAEGKALSIAKAGDDWVIGSDSVVELDGARYSKPRDRDEAACHLAAFSGHTLQLSSAVALAHRGRIDWSHSETARLDVRPLSPHFIHSYLDAEWPAVSYCVGVFRMEALGVTLFEKVEGSHFTILGMPLLPLLGALRQRGLMAS
jgi:septum formation protein